VGSPVGPKSPPDKKTVSALAVDGSINAPVNNRLDPKLKNLMEIAPFLQNLAHTYWWAAQLKN